MTSTAISMPNATARFQDIEAQAPARKFNPMATRAKMAGMAVVGTAGVIATALLASMDPLAPNTGGRQLLEGQNDHGCSPKQLANIATAKKALIISGITGGSGLGAVAIGSCLGGLGSLAGPAAAAPGIAIASLGATAFVFSLPATLISGIIYAVKKKEC